MRTLIRRRLPDGSRQEQVVESVSLTLGRGTENAVELQGPSVAPRHAKLSCTVPGRYLVEAMALGGLDVNGVPGQQDCELGPGDRLRIGDHVITIAPPADGHDLIIDVQLADLARAAPTRREARISLVATGLGYRDAAWGLASVILVLALLLPLASRGLAEHWPGLLPSDDWWSSGRISGGHSHFAGDCMTCHQSLFVRVEDAACTACHTGTRHHSDDPAIRAVPGFEDVRCASCHREHDAFGGLDPGHPEICTDCHARPDFAAFPDLAPASDFGGDHPEFRPTVTLRGDDGAPREERRPQSAETTDRHGLVFNHALHLDPQGVRVADGLRVLACADCHAPDASRMGFLPSRYDAHCADCHALDAQLGDATVRLPHGSDELLRELLEKYVRQAGAAAATPVAEPELRRRPGEGAERGERGGVAEAVRSTAQRLCGKCHEMAAADLGPPQTRPLALRQSWLVHARFTHAEHEAMACGRCHGAERSQLAEELMLPTLADCRMCHAGVDSASGVSSTCIDCHRLHQARQPWSSETRAGGDASDGEPQAQR